MMFNKSQNKYSGISLIELMLTLMLISVLLGTGYVSFNKSIMDQNSKSAAEQVVLAVKKAKFYSRSKGIKTSLSFPAGSNTYSISADGETITNDNNFDATSGKLPKNIEILQNNCNDMNFYVNGTPIDSVGDRITNSCTIIVGYDEGPQKTITIRGNSGNVSYE